MNILKAVKLYLKDNPWPDKQVTVGPFTCGQRRCRKNHAWARTICSPGEVMRGRTEPSPDMWFWVHFRPCDRNDPYWAGKYFQDVLHGDKKPNES
jgi:hypothetical protein